MDPHNHSDYVHNSMMASPNDDHDDSPAYRSGSGGDEVMDLCQDSETHSSIPFSFVPLSSRGSCVLNTASISGDEWGDSHVSPNHLSYPLDSTDGNYLPRDTRSYGESCGDNDITLGWDPCQDTDSPAEDTTSPPHGFEAGNPGLLRPQASRSGILPSNPTATRPPEGPPPNLYHASPQYAGDRVETESPIRYGAGGYDAGGYGEGESLGFAQNGNPDGQSDPWVPLVPEQPASTHVSCVHSASHGPGSYEHVSQGPPTSTWSSYCSAELLGDSIVTEKPLEPNGVSAAVNDQDLSSTQISDRPSSLHGGQRSLMLARYLQTPPSRPSTGARLVVCGVCGREFSGEYARGNLARHRRQKHDENGVQCFPCGIDSCSKYFRRKDARLKHYRRRHPELMLNPLVPRKSENDSSRP